MFENKESARKHLIAWFKKMGFTEKIQFSMSYGLITIKGRSAWNFDVSTPHGVFFVFNDNGDVEDNYGHFGGTANILYDAEGNAK